MRQLVGMRYRQALGDIAGITVPQTAADTQQNYGYFPILVDGSYPLSRDSLYQRLRDSGVLRAPVLLSLDQQHAMYRGLPSAAPAISHSRKQFSDQIICLPIYPDLSMEDQARIVDIVREAGEVHTCRSVA